MLREPVVRAIDLSLLSKKMTSPKDEDELIGAAATQIARFTKTEADLTFTVGESLFVCRSVNGQSHYRAALQLLGSLTKAGAPLGAAICYHGYKC